MKKKSPGAYDHTKIESKWQKQWEKKKSFQAHEPKGASKASPKKKFFGLIEFPYPSGDGLHVGHIRSNTAMDIIARKRRREGFEVLYPVGWDAFGLPTENYAIKTGIQPAIVTKKNTDTFRRQLKALGFSFDWSREINTTDPAYYRWTQWIFLQFLKKGLAYKKKMTINWCPKDLIGLANEEVVNGCCERCGTAVEKRDKEQWMLAITKYADKLLAGLDARVSPAGDLIEGAHEEPCFTQMRGVGTMRPDLPLVERDAIIAIVKHWSEDKYIGLKWKKVAWKTLITGGPEKGQTAEEAAIMEIQQETGYQHPKLVRSLGRVHAKFFHVPKQVNRFAHFDALYFELQDSEHIALSAEEQAIHEVVWLSREEMTAFLTPDSQKYVWAKFLDPSANALSDIKPLLDWKESIKDSQRNWIGKSEGAEIDFTIKNSEKKITVFTTRPDTLFGVTYIVLAPEHPWMSPLLEHIENRKEVEEYILKAKKETDIERTDAKKEKTGVQLKGIKAVNPANNEEIPVWIADYVLADYGTGAVMAVPAHDERDGEFAKKYGLPVKQVIEPKFVGTSGDGAVEPGLEFVRREAVCAIVRNPKDDTYLCISWKGVHMHGLVTGGIEDGEDVAETARREVMEETGYKNLKFIKNAPIAINTYFYHRIKKQNRWAHFHFAFFELENEERIPVDEKEAALHEVVWKKKSELKEFFTVFEGDFLVTLLNEPDYVHTGPGLLTNSGSFIGTDSETVKKEITESVGGRWITTFKLRDWIFSRQRYWGEPIPVVHCDKCGIVPVPEKDLPVKLPKVKNYKPTETGESPLAAISSWVNTTCPNCVANKNKPRYLIFDFDGVLGNTWTESNEVKVTMGDSRTVEDAAQVTIQHFDRKPSAVRNHSLSAEQLQKKHEWITTFGKHLSETDFRLFAGFVSELKKIKNAKFAVVSSGSSQYVLPALKKSGLKFTHILAYEDHYSKEEKVEQVCKDWGITPKEAYYFTDTKADVLELEDIMGRERIIGCAWGWHGYDKLRELLPEKMIMKEFKDIRKVLNLDCSAKRETDTMPNWAGSSWYYLRYADPKNKKVFADRKKLDYWTPVDWYNGGMEHTTLHLLYSRFWHKFLYDLGLVPTSEPYMKRTSHGLILAAGGEKMSKSKGNVINPDGIISAVGADSLRLYEMFMGPFDQPIAWNTDNIAGVRRFIERVWKLRERVFADELSTERSGSNKIIHKTIKKVSDDIEAMRFNTAISSMMIALNELEKSESVERKNYEVLLQLLAPFAPHVTEELWASLGNKDSIHTSSWPMHDASLAVDSEATIMIQINGKVRGSFTAPVDTTRENLEKLARETPEAKKWLEGKSVQKVIVVPNKLVNIVVV